MYARKLNKAPAHRISMLKTMSSQLLEKGKIQTTLAKAREVGVFAEKLITKAKEDSLHARRQAINLVRGETLVKSLFEKIAPSFASRKGGFTRVIKLGKRRGDAAEMAMIELVSSEVTEIKK